MHEEAEGLAVAERPRHGGPRKGAGRPKGERTDKAVKIDRVIADKAFVVAKHRGITMVELLSGMLRGPMDKAYAQVVKSLDRQGDDQ